MRKTASRDNLRLPYQGSLKGSNGNHCIRGYVMLPVDFHRVPVETNCIREVASGFIP
jgi:hypothetical protein